MKRAAVVFDRVATLPDKPRIAALDPSAAQQIMKLVYSVFLLPGESAPKTIVIAGVDAPSGDICIHAGESLAENTTRSICIVDANFEHPSMHEALGLELSPGLRNAIGAESVAASATQISKHDLWFLSAGSKAGSAGLFAAKGVQAVIGELKHDFDYVLVSAPPVLVSDRGLLFARHCDGMLLVIQAHATRRESARTAKSVIENAGIKLFGAVLNNRRFPIPELLYRRL